MKQHKVAKIPRASRWSRSARWASPPTESTPEQASPFQIYSPLIFSLFYFIGPFYSGLGGWQLAVVLVVFVIQVYLYHMMAVAKRKDVVGIAVAASIALGFVTAPLNHSSYSFYWFCAYFAAFTFNRNTALLVFVCILAAVVITAEQHGYHELWYYLPVIIPTLGLLSYGFYDKQAHIHAQAQRKSQDEIEQLAIVAERERIARDLHDVMGHSLSTIALKAQLADKLGKAGDAEAALGEIREVAAISRDTLSEMRSVITGYRARSLEQQVERLVQSLKDWNYQVDDQLQLPQLTAQEESALVLVLTEAITNILKHCQGSRVSLRTQTSPEEQPDADWALYVEDNGRPEQVEVGNGLSGMRERLENIGAQLQIDTQNGMKLAMYFHRQAEVPA